MPQVLTSLLAYLIVLAATAAVCVMIIRANRMGRDMALPDDLVSSPIPLDPTAAHAVELLRRRFPGHVVLAHPSVEEMLPAETDEAARARQLRQRFAGTKTDMVLVSTRTHQPRAFIALGPRHLDIREQTRELPPSCIIAEFETLDTLETALGDGSTHPLAALGAAPTVSPFRRPGRRSAKPPAKS